MPTAPEPPLPLASPPRAPMGPPPEAGAVGLGLDAGGTHTRWALAQADGVVVASGELAAMSGQQLASAEGRQQLVDTLHRLAGAVGAAGAGRGAGPGAGSAGHPARPPALGELQPNLNGARPLRALLAGVTGFDAQAMPQWRALAAQALALPEQQVCALSDIDLTCAAAFEPGQGVVLIAGTGSIAAHVDAQGRLHRAGGRGAVIDDAGGGHWIARQALQHIWRAEDREPGSWQSSALARRVFDHIGGPDWAQTRQWVYGATRGELGTLAVAVAQAARADGSVAADPAALDILQRAGQELARLVMALLQRVGAQPVALAGRVFDLHPLVEASLRQALPAATALHRLQTPVHHAAARRAAAGVPPQWQR